MEIGLFGVNMGPLGTPEACIRAARAAEDAGFDSVWAGEHVVLPEPQEPPSPLPAGVPMLDPNICFAWLAGQTERIKFGTGIIILPQRNPLVLAKEMASLDVLCNGRLIFGIGIGYLKAEFDALGIPFKQKGERTLEYLDAMNEIWRDDNPSYQGQFVNFSGVRAMPRPVQNPGPPAVFGGHVPGAFARTVTHGAGWYGFGLNVEQTAECIKGLRAAEAEHERGAGLGPIEISVSPWGNIDLDKAKQYADLGVERLIVLFPTESDDILFSQTVTEQEIIDYINRLGDEVVGKL